MRRIRLLAVVAVMLAGASCGDSGEEPQPAASSTPPAPTTVTTTQPTPSTTFSTTGPAAIADFTIFEPVDPNLYYIEHDRDPGTSLRAVFAIREEGWRSWAGTYKPDPAHEPHVVALTIAAPTHVRTDPCHDGTWAEPGPTTRDFADALAELPGVTVTQEPEEVTAYGYPGTHVAIQLPDIPHDPALGPDGFEECTDKRFYGWRGGTGHPEGVLDRRYHAPNELVDFWVLDVDGTRLLIEVVQFPDSPVEDLAELDGILASLTIEP